MKRLLLALAAAALTAGTAAAQTTISHEHARCPFRQINTSELLGGEKPETFQLEKRQIMKAPAKAETKQSRNPKQLSYAIDGEVTDSLAGYVVTSFKRIKQYQWQMGYFQCFHTDMLRRFAGNKLGKIKFLPFKGVYSNARMVIWDDKSYNEATGVYDKCLWKKDIEIKPNQVNEVDCDLVIPNDEEFLDHGFSVVFYADVEADPADTTDTKDYFCSIVYPDEANVEHSSAIVLYDKKDGQYYCYDDLSDDALNPAIWIDTEGDGGLKAEDAMPYYATKARGLAGTEQSLEASFYNLGTDSIRSVDYTVENAGQIVSGTARFQKPVKLFDEATFRFNLPLNAAPGYYNTGKLTITKVNGQDDEFTDNNDNELTGIHEVALKDAYRRTPVLEEFTSVSCGWCPYGIIGLEKAMNAVGGKAVAVAAHEDFSPIFAYFYGSDPLISDSYRKVVQRYTDSFPTIYVNREVMNHAYTGIDDVVKAMAAAPCEASMTLTPAKTADGSVQFTTTVNFLVDVPAGRYALAYAISEDNVEKVAQLNYFAMNYRDAMRSENPDPEKVEWLNSLDDAEKKLAMAESFSLDEEYPEDLMSYFTMDHVACSIVDPSFVESAVEQNRLILPALKAGEDLTRTYTMPLPKREAKEGEQYTSPVPAVKEENLKYAVYLIDAYSGVILTGCQTAIGETSESKDKFDLTGINSTPAADAAPADIRIADGCFIVSGSGAEATVYDAMGRLVGRHAVNGEVSLPVTGKGVFMVRVVKDGRTLTRKAVF